MTDSEIITEIRKHITLATYEADIFLRLLTLRTLRKNEILVRRGESVCPFTLIKSGCLMTYITDNTNVRHVIQFGFEMWWTGDLESVLKQTPSAYSIKALDRSEVYCLDNSSLERLYTEIPAFERYFRIIFQNSLINHQKRLIRTVSMSAEERYQAFRELHPQIELLVPQKYIASYLGITPEFLSKLRRKLAGK